MRELNTSYTVGEAHQITGISPDRWRYWHTRGLLEPSAGGPEVRRPRPGARGRRAGSPHRRYSRADVLAGVLIRELLSVGLTFQRVRKAVATLRVHFGAKPLHEALRGTRFRLVVSGNRVLVLEGSAAWEMGAERGGQGVLPPLDLARTARTAEDLITGWWRRKKIADQAWARAHEARVKRDLARKRRALVET